MRPTLAIAVSVGLSAAVSVLLVESLGLPLAARALLVLSVGGVAAFVGLRAQLAWTGIDRARAKLATLMGSNEQATPDAAALTPLVDALETRLDAERRESAHREIILEAAAEGAPTAVVLLAEAGRVIYANPAARELLAEGAALEGENFLRLLSHAPQAFREAFLGESDEIFTVEIDGEAETYHLSKRELDQHGRRTTLVLVKHLTREIRRQEVDVWKKLIRILSHELNNSLAPITSLVHSARRIAVTPEQLPKLDRVLATVEERAAHLAQFLEGYARFARLPKPQRVAVDWGEFLGRMQLLAPWVTVGQAPRRPGYFDATQVEQVVVNLLKNAEESGGAREEIRLEVNVVEGGVDLCVSDRGSGMTAQTLSKALLPFYSTKERGSGLGLTLCREIIEAHGGKLRLTNRTDGGLVVACFLPDKDFSAPPSQARLTLTRG